MSFKIIRLCLKTAKQTVVVACTLEKNAREYLALYQDTADNTEFYYLDDTGNPEITYNHRDNTWHVNTPMHTVH